MENPTYFSKFPNLKYPIRMNRAGITETVNIKDYFHLLKLRDDVFNDDTMYEPNIMSRMVRDQTRYQN